MSELHHILEQKILKEGPLKISTFMDLCLFHPHHGYYKKSLPLGSSGDFITAPEISQLFGEMIGLYFVDLWEKLNTPISFNFIEFGPGNGTLLRDIMGVFQKFSLLNKTHFFLLEINPRLRQKQDLLWRPFGAPCRWFDEISTLLTALPSLPTFFVGNEFLDVFPIDQHIFKETGWWERCVTFEAGSFKIEEIPCPAPPLAFPSNPPFQTIFESSPTQEDFFQKLLQGLEAFSFSGLFIDYGYGEGEGDSLQSISQHKFSSIFDNIGDQDLTAHVNFKRLNTLLKQKAPHIQRQPLVPQGLFLRNLGIDIRAQMLIQSNPNLKKNFEEALFRLTDPSQMGTLFKVFNLHTT